jgi:hypothetical protein
MGKIKTSIYPDTVFLYFLVFLRVDRPLARLGNILHALTAALRGTGEDVKDNEVKCSQIRRETELGRSSVCV